MDSGARKVPFSTLKKIGCVVSLIQTKIDEGLFCDKDTEGLLIYNFQPIMAHKGMMYCSLDMLVKPIEEMDATHILQGKPQQVAINAATNEVINNTQSMLDLGLITEDDIVREELEPPIIYGNYSTHHALCSFMAIASQDPVLPGHLFSGKYDTSALVLKSPVFDCIVEARDHLISSDDPVKWIVELTQPKEELPVMLSNGVSHFAIKCFSTDCSNIHVTTKSYVSEKEANIEDQIHHLREIPKDKTNKT